MECSFWPDGIPVWLGGRGDEWLECCRAHDQVEMTVASALELGRCVADVSPAMGTVMAVGVLIFGSFYLAIKTRLWTRP